MGYAQAFLMVDSMLNFLIPMKMSLTGFFKAEIMKRVGAVIGLLLIIAGAGAQQRDASWLQNREIVIEPQRFNTIASDISPFFIGDKLFFSSVREKYFNRPSRDRRNMTFYDVYSVSLDDKGFVTSDRSLAGGFGSDYHEGPGAWCEATGELFVTLSNVIDPDTIPKFLPLEYIRLRLAIKKKIDGVWKITEELPFNRDDVNFAHPAISITGDTLIFSSDLNEDNQGKTDLFMSVRKNGQWSDPVNLGSRFNTPGDEMFPVFGPDGLLFFSSDGHPGSFGQLDIFYTSFPGSGPVFNVGNKINSTHDDFGLVIHPSGDVAYFTSDRPGRGSDDIYRIDLIRTTRLFAGRVLDDFTEEPIPESDVLLSDCTGKVLNSTLSDNQGKFSFEISPDGCNAVEASKEGYQNDFKNIAGLDYVELRLKRLFMYQLVVMDLGTHLPVGNASVSCGDRFSMKTNASGSVYPLISKDNYCDFRISADDYLDQTLPVDPAIFLKKQHSDTVWLFKPELNRLFTLKNIYYDFDKYNIRPDARPPLDNLIRIMTDYPVSIELSSHTDSRGSDEYNQVLSQNRAQSAIEYIIRGGISSDRLSAFGYGESRHVNHCFNDIPCSEAMHQANRRTEFRITAFGQPGRMVTVTAGQETVVIGTANIQGVSQPDYFEDAYVKKLPEDLSDTFFSVQIMAVTHSILDEKSIFKGEKDVFEMHLSPYFKYYVGKYRSYAEAVGSKVSLQQKFPGSFVVAFKEGKVINVSDLLNELSE